MKMDGRTVGCAAHGADVVPLVERHGKHGVFFGCSHYPRCRTLVDLRRGKFGGAAVVYLPPGVWVDCGSPEHWQWWRLEMKRRQEHADGVFREQRFGDYFDRDSPYDDALDDANPALPYGLNLILRADTGYEIFARLFGEEVISEHPEHQ